MAAGGRLKRRSTRAKLLLLFAAASVSILAVEGVLRLGGWCTPDSRTYVGEFENRASRNFIPDPQTGWRMRPGRLFQWRTSEFKNSYQANGQGFRAAFDFDATDPRAGIALLGDSFTFGTGVAEEETYGARIAASFPALRVCNFAMPGFGLDQAWQSLRHQAPTYRPRLAVVGVFPEMLTRSLNAYRVKEGMNKPCFQLVDGRLIARTVEDRPAAPLRFLDRHCRLYELGRRAYRGLGYRVPVGEWWNLNARILDAMRDDARQAGVTVLFVYLPSNEWRRFGTLEDYMRRCGAEYLDLTRRWPQPPDGFFYPRDGHPTAEGHRRIAEAVVEWIRTHMPDLVE